MVSQDAQTAPADHPAGMAFFCVLITLAYLLGLLS
jgi:hypothetical protein